MSHTPCASGLFLFYFEDRKKKKYITRDRGKEVKLTVDILIKESHLMFCVDATNFF